MKTIMIWQSTGELGLTFFCFEEDMTRFNGVYINEYVEDEDRDKLQDELAEIMFDDNDGEYAIPHIHNRFPAEFYDKDTKVIVCGFIE